jgi:hypothetical protein
LLFAQRTPVQALSDVLDRALQARGVAGPGRRARHDFTPIFGENGARGYLVCNRFE